MVAELVPPVLLSPMAPGTATALRTTGRRRRRVCVRKDKEKLLNGIYLKEEQDSGRAKAACEENGLSMVMAEQAKTRKGTILSGALAMIRGADHVRHGRTAAGDGCRERRQRALQIV